ncbi:ubiquitin carboxyl-terminal hydrolase 36 [Anaeramoeba flamelloides]|uniref:Ubiquitin carboxyl-terminal hydrolase 36 n=1 Tax=Anaeramoeba flamelloides TaxID=1746091 RepID=A0ABQ8ZCL6_9EUKA|nr:ubiquitin carboxyl-terminal hydrolase 36 [Anaeramoeba flamelloides]
MIDQTKIPFPRNKHPLKYNTNTFQYCPEKEPKPPDTFGSSRRTKKYCVWHATQMKHCRWRRYDETKMGGKYTKPPLPINQTKLYICNPCYYLWTKYNLFLKKRKIEQKEKKKKKVITKPKKNTFIFKTVPQSKKINTTNLDQFEQKRKESSMISKKKQIVQCVETEIENKKIHIEPEEDKAEAVEIEQIEQIEKEKEKETSNKKEKETGNEIEIEIVKEKEKEKEKETSKKKEKETGNEIEIEKEIEIVKEKEPPKKKRKKKEDPDYIDQEECYSDEEQVNTLNIRKNLLKLNEAYLKNHENIKAYGKISPYKRKQYTLFLKLFFFSSINFANSFFSFLFQFQDFMIIKFSHSIPQNSNIMSFHLGLRLKFINLPEDLFSDLIQNVKEKSLQYSPIWIK